MGHPQGYHNLLSLLFASRSARRQPKADAFGMFSKNSETWRVANRMERRGRSPGQVNGGQGCRDVFKGNDGPQKERRRSGLPKRWERRRASHGRAAAVKTAKTFEKDDEGPLGPPLIPEGRPTSLSALRAPPETNSRRWAQAVRNCTVAHQNSTRILRPGPIGVEIAEAFGGKKGVPWDRPSSLRAGRHPCRR